MAADEASAPGEVSPRLLWLLFAFALALRVLLLGRTDLWCDEILFVQLSSPPQSPFAVWDNLWTSFLSIGHFPVPCVIENIFLWLVKPFTGGGIAPAFWLRLPAVLFGAACVPVLVRLGTLVGGRAAGLAAGICYATFLYPVFFAREAYFYAPLAFFCLCGVHGFLRLSGGDPIRRPLRLAVLTAASLGAASLSHVTGILLSLSLLPVGVAWLFTRPAGQTRNRAWLPLVIGLAGTLPALPFYLKRILQGSPMKFGTPNSVGTVLADGVGKQFFGTHPVALAVAGALILAGLGVCLYTRDSRRRLRFALAVIAVLLFGAIFAGSRGTLYFSRYFNAATGLLYLLFALGLTCIPLRIKPGTPVVAAAAAAIVHLVLFLPTMYALPAKGVNYGGLARALNATLPAGTPYVMESGYEMRFVPGFFTTPGLVAACPYIHGELGILWERQRQFFEQFPEAAYVESAHHGASPRETTGIFEWPRKHFRRKLDVDNPQLARLARLGIWPQAVDDTTVMVQSHSTIYYNTPADNDAIAREAGRGVVFDFPGWRVTEIQRFVYARAAEGGQAAISVRNLGSGAVTGRLRMPVAIIAPQLPYQVNLFAGGNIVASRAISGGVFQSLETGPMTFNPGTTEIRLHVSRGDASQLKAIVVPSAEFVAEPAKP